MRKYLIFGLFILFLLSMDASAENVVEVSKEFVVKNWWDRILLWLVKKIENENEKPLSICSLSLYPPFRDIYM
jgi:hypothetical protein